MDLHELKKQSDQIRSENLTGKSIFWPKDFKDQAVALINSGKSIATLSRFTGISASTIYSWKHARASKQKKYFKQVKIVKEDATALSLSWVTGLSIDGLSFVQVKELLSEGLL